VADDGARRAIHERSLSGIQLMEGGAEGGRGGADSPASLDDAVTRLRVAIRRMLGAEGRLRLRDRPERTELTLRQQRALICLQDKDEVTAGEIARSAGLSPATTTVMLDQLEDGGIICRRRAAGDRRRVVVTLTEHGRELVDMNRRLRADEWNERFGDFTPEELAVATRVIHHFTMMLNDS
jgi:DNA-binding MarR family transcriptional regulator